jgi:hypothetical protein
MTMEIVGFVVLMLHAIVIGTIILWFGLGTPPSVEQFWVRLKTGFLGGGGRSK